MADRCRHGKQWQPCAAGHTDAAVNQIDAAVVNPRTTSRRMKITLPPMKPIPDTTCAATRDGSRTIRPFARMSMNPYFETSIIRAAETPTRVWVLRPALF